MGPRSIERGKPLKDELNLRIVASMGPRSIERGKKNRKSLSKDFLGLQWGRVQSNAERGRVAGFVFVYCQDRFCERWAQNGTAQEVL